MDLVVFSVVLILVIFAACGLAIWAVVVSLCASLHPAARAVRSDAAESIRTTTAARCGWSATALRRRLVARRLSCLAACF